MPKGQHVKWTTGHIARVRKMRALGASYRGIAAALKVYEDIDVTAETLRVKGATWGLPRDRRRGVSIERQKKAA